MTSGEEKLFVSVAQIAEDGRVAPKRLVVSEMKNTNVVPIPIVVITGHPS